ncbi:MAG: hypothetical protein ABW022_18185 [Actinoplanes sp.]
MAAVVAVAGILLTAFGRGLALQVQFEGRNADGTANATGSDVLGELNRLGSQRPTGIGLSQNTDVTTLPDDALSALPQGKLAGLLLQLFRFALPAIPWHVKVQYVNDSRAVVHILRNGRLVDSAVMRMPPKTDKPAEESAAVLATDAAAFVLTTLASVHPALKLGLNGADRWTSVALQVRGQRITDSSRQRQMLAQAVEYDPRNVAAKVGLLQVGGLLAVDAEAHLAYAKGLDEVLEKYIPAVAEKTGIPEAGWETLQIRVLFNASVTWMNYFLLVQSPCDPWHRAWELSGRLDRILRSKRMPRDVRPFADDIEPANWFLRQAILAAKNCRCHLEQDKWPLLAEPETVKCGLSMTAVYTRACYRTILAHKGNGSYDAALDDLALAANLDFPRLYAQRDPSFAPFRSPETAEKYVARYRKIVWPHVPPAFLELPPFAMYADDLRGKEISKPGDLLTKDPNYLASTFGISRTTADRWLAIARLANTTTGAGAARQPIGIEVLVLLLHSDITKASALQTALAGHNRREFLAKLHEAADSYGVVRPTADEVASWRPI